MTNRGDPMTPLVRGRRAAALATALLAGLVLAGVAHADPTCTYDAATPRRDVTQAPSPDFFLLSVYTGPAGFIGVFAETTAGDHVDVGCGGASVTSTDRISASGHGTVIFDASNAAFAPGATP